MNRIFKSMAVLFMAAATMLTFSCKKDNTSTSEGGDGSFVTAKGDFTYKVNLNPASVTAITKAYDVFVDYYDADGTIKSSTEITPSNLTWEKTVSKTSFPAWFGVRLRMVPKSDLSGVSDNDDLNLRGTVELKGKYTSKAGKTREVFKSDDIIKNGVDPHNGTTYSTQVRCQVMANGERETYVSWE